MTLFKRELKTTQRQVQQQPPRQQLQQPPRQQLQQLRQQSQKISGLRKFWAISMQCIRSLQLLAFSECQSLKRAV